MGGTQHSGLSTQDFVMERRPLKTRERAWAKALGTETFVGSSPLCVQGESCREAAGALISSITDACDVAQRRAQSCSIDSLQPQQKPFGATSDRRSDPLCEMACVLRSRCTQSDEEPLGAGGGSSVEWTRQRWLGLTWPDLSFLIFSIPE